jgi:anaerobic ribonucleoside-triphosphate reductase activating protein
MDNFRQQLASRGLLNVARLVLDSRSNGPGCRAVLWLQGCSIHCEGCINRAFWDFSPVTMIDPAVLPAKVLVASSDCEGLTITGGEPFDQSSGLSRLAVCAQESGLSVLVYTGYTLEQLEHQADGTVRQALENIDILIDGPFMSSLRCSGPAVGSTNQGIHFLSGRYSEAVLDSGRDWLHEEYILDEQSKLIHTGIFQPGSETGSS